MADEKTTFEIALRDNCITATRGIAWHKNNALRQGSDQANDNDVDKSRDGLPRQSSVDQGPNCA